MKPTIQSATARRRLLLNSSLAALAVAAVVPPTAWAQSPPLTIVVGAAAAGSLDLQARALAAAMQSAAGRAVSVQNQVGNAGTVAAEAVANARGNAAILLMHNGYFQSALAASVQPVALISETALGLWRNSAPANTQANLAFGGAPATYSFVFANLAALGQLGGAAMTPIPYRGVAPALGEARSSGDFFLAELSNLDAAREQGMQLVATSSPRVAEKLGLAPAVRAVPGLRELVIPVGLYAPPGAAVAADVLADIDKAVASPGFQSFLKSKQHVPPAQASPSALVDQVNAFGALAEAGVAAGASSFIQPPHRLALATSRPVSPSQQSPALRDDPKTVGRGVRGG